MNKAKKLIFFIIMIILIGVLIYNKHSQVSYKVLEVKELYLSEGEYKVGRDIAEAIYDVEVIEGSILFNKMSIEKGGRVLSYNFMFDNNILIEGSGKVKITPAKQEKLSFINNSYIIEDSGNYEVGKSIDSGKYTLTYYCDDEKYRDKNPLIQILNSKNSDIIESYDFTSTNIYTIELDESQTLQVYKGLFEDYKNYYILLQAIK